MDAFFLPTCILASTVDATCWETVVAPSRDRSQTREFPRVDEFGQIYLHVHAESIFKETSSGLKVQTFTS